MIKATPKMIVKAIAGRYRQDLKPRSLYACFHAAADDLSQTTGQGRPECIGHVFAWLANLVGTKPGSEYLGRVLTIWHKDGRLDMAIQAAVRAAERGQDVA